MPLPENALGFGRGRVFEVELDFRRAVIIVLFELSGDMDAAAPRLQQCIAQRRSSGAKCDGPDPLPVPAYEAQAHMIGADNAGIDHQHVGHQEHGFGVSCAIGAGAVDIVEELQIGAGRREERIGDKLARKDKRLPLRLDVTGEKRALHI